MSELNHPASINRDYIRLLQVMRRFVREEFAVSIRMTQEDAIEQLLHYAGESRNHVLQEMARELEEFTDNTSAEDVQEEQAEGGAKVRYYRGAAIVVEEEDEKNAQAAAAEPKQPPSGGKKIYRGRVVSG